MTKKQQNSRKRNAQRKGRKNGPLPESGGRFDDLGGIMVRFPGVGLPKRLRATVRMEQQGYLAVGSAASGLAEIYANSYFEPFNTGLPLNTAWGFNFTASSATAKQFTPNSVFSLMYDNYRVHDAMLKVSAVCGATGDTMQVWMVPADLVPATTGVLSANSAAPGFKSMLLSSGNMLPSIVSKVHCRDVLGMTQTDYIAAGSNAAIGAAPATLASWLVSYATVDGGVTTGQVYFTFQLEYDVEFFNPTNPAS